VSRLLKRLKGSHSPRSIALAALIAAVALGCIALIWRGLGWLGASPNVAPPGQPPSAQARSVAAASALELGTEILARNIFDSTSGALSWELAQERPQGDAAESSDAGGPLGSGRCSGDLRLLASVVRAKDPNLSLAALRKDGKTHIVTVGERLGELELLVVLPTAAFFRDGTGSSCSLSVYTSANEPTPLPPPEPPPQVAVEPPTRLTKPDAETVSKRPPAFSEEELQKNIKKLGPARYAVTRELFARARLNPSGISRGARFKPQTRDGRAAGMQVARLRDDSLLAHLGVQQGDVLRGINGYGLGSADGVLEAFGHLGKQKEVTLSIERDGAPTTIQYVLE
jgi:hypothetical protein